MREGVKDNPTCRKCGVKLIIDINWQRSGPGTYNYICKKCHKERYHIRKKQGLIRPRKYNQDIHLRARYRISYNYRKEVYKDQNGRCLICNKYREYDNIDTDHCHKTNIFRGLLCRGCNSKLGWFEKYEEAILNHVRKTRSLTSEEDLISIIIPTLNRAEMLRTRSIPSIINQTYKNWELIIVGDHCTDNTEKIINSFHDNRIKYFNLPEKKLHYSDTQKNAWLVGPTIALNKCLEMVNGKYTARLDDEDYWLDTHLEILIKAIKKRSCDLISANTMAISNGKTYIVQPYYNPKIGSVQSWLWKSELNQYKYSLDSWRKEWDKNNEIDWYKRVYNDGYKFDFIDDIITLIYPRPGETEIGSKAYVKE